ncbi:hypothetical protein BEWA_028960 [Theileria equi strain WA]|uniref:Uncharacterized protein n=1 Tax=Theileria equi strain WA TaxID=1537102 RepID=L0AYF6_THEEQ|nr:hypothetical protein BEWA_028960 [Theileria equi strain WA]AFZ80046.1 hypothetical protein BEWA_028960 [Theileria equi strain WA]|eukprot:XP_004829712.1 hypothetical protein BEWA_028960 [Theileria equi strain WA]
MDTTANLSLGLPINNFNNAAESSYFDYSPYYPTYSCYQDEQDYADRLANKRLIYRSIPYYNNELKSLEDINRSSSISDPMVNVFYGNSNSLESLPSDSYNNKALNKYRDVTRPSCDEKSGPYDRHYERHNGYDRSSPYDRHYDGRNMNGDVKKVKLSDLIKLTEAMRELTSRLPMPPSPELLQSINPSLAATLQLTYLKAYIQNQQLLLDLKSSLEGSFPVDIKYNVGSHNSISPPTNDIGLSLAKLDGLYDLPGGQGVNCVDNLPKIRDLSPNENENKDLMPKISDVSCEDIVDFQDYMQFANDVTFPEIEDDSFHKRKILRITNGESDDLESSTNDSESGKGTRIGKSLAGGDLAIVEARGAKTPFGGNRMGVKDKSVSNRKITSNVNRVKKVASGTESAKRDFLGKVPKELKKFVKYDSTKNSYVAVFLGPTGLRKRKAFSVRKFGADGALKRAETFALGSSGVMLAVKERGLLEQICTTALQLNPKSREDIKLYEHAQAMEHCRGLVYSCGGQMWLSVYYNSLSKRGIKGFLVSEYGFQGAYDAAKAFLESMEHTVQSKLSGALSFWLENEGCKVLCLVVPFKPQLRSMIRPVNGPTDSLSFEKVEETRLCIGRFELDVHGGFVKTRKVAQDWCNAIKAGTINAFCNGTDTGNGGIDASKLPGVVYESFIDCWIANCNGKSKRFYVKTLGTSEARRRAIHYRNNFLNTQEC